MADDGDQKPPAISPNDLKEVGQINDEGSEVPRDAQMETTNAEEKASDGSEGASDTDANGNNTGESDDEDNDNEGKGDNNSDDNNSDGSSSDSESGSDVDSGSDSDSDSDDDSEGEKPRDGISDYERYVNNASNIKNRKEMNLRYMFCR